MLNIPECVPKQLVEELEGYQNQIKILIRNYKILKDRHQNSPEDELVPQQIKQVEQFIVQFNEKQLPVIAKIRDIIKNQDPQSSKSSDDDSKYEDEKPISEEEIIANLGLKNVARTANGKIDHAKLSMKDRMAIVRGMRKRRKKGSNNGGLKKRSPSPELSGDPNEEQNDDFQDNQYKGHVTDIEKFQMTPTFVELKDNFELEKRRPEINLATCDKPSFLTNLNLFEPKEIESIQEVLEKDAKRKILFRNMTYIPEISDKKHKVSYTYLAPDINSPPLLRTRQRRPVFGGGGSSTMASRANSRATTPDRISNLSRQMSNDSEPSAKKSLGFNNDTEKTALEDELNSLQKRSDALQDLLSSKKRTVSTRKERSRLSEVSDESVQLEVRIEQIKKLLSTMKK